jgi:hypothetical protein
LVQVLGRVYRAGAKTPVIQKIVYCAKTWEDKICKTIKRKLSNISGINDGDLMGFLIDRVSKNSEFENSKYEVITTDEYNKLVETTVE